MISVTQVRARPDDPFYPTAAPHGSSANHRLKKPETFKIKSRTRRAKLLGHLRELFAAAFGLAAW
jgi:hypothetical protein